MINGVEAIGGALDAALTPYSPSTKCEARALLAAAELSSVRLDVVEGSLANPRAVYDLKTGGASLTPSRIQQIQSQLPSSNVPVYEVRP